MGFLHPVFRTLRRPDDIGAAYDRLKSDGLLAWVYSALDEDPPRGHFITVFTSRARLILATVNNTPTGVMALRPFMARSRCALMGAACFRPFPLHPALLAREASRWVFDHLPFDALTAFVPAGHHHILRLCAGAGFTRAATLPGLSWHRRKGGFVDTVMLIATRAAGSPAVPEGMPIRQPVRPGAAPATVVQAMQRGE